MTKVLGILSVLLVILLAMGFAAANAGTRVTLVLGIVTLYRVPVTLVAFVGLLAGMLVMFATGIHSDLKVRRILRERLADESRREQRWIDRNQVDLFTGGGPSEAAARDQRGEVALRRVEASAPPSGPMDETPPAQPGGPESGASGRPGFEEMGGPSSEPADGPPPENTSGQLPRE